MHKEIIVNANPYEVRIAILEDKELVELLIERAENKRMVGDIYKGVVTAVLPGIQAAFVDIGTEKAAFLHVSDLLEVRDDEDDEPGDRRRPARGQSRPPLPPIQDILHKGQELLVQVTKEPIATKGPRITSQISLPGRFAVIMPDVDHVGVSRKIEDRAERARLKEIVTELKPPDCALIVRTVGEGASRSALELDVQHLVSVWREVQAKAKPAPAPSLVHQDVGIVIGLVRDVFNEEVDQLVLDDRGAYDELKSYLRGFAPELADRVKLHEEPVPIFDKYGIESELDKTLDRKVWLKKGGYILIDQTEALVAIDVNTGRFTGKKNQEETILKTNLLAAREVARQLRLRDIGGIIVIDFIDMESDANKKKVLQDLRTWLKRDRAKTKAFQVSDLGLVEMSRQRVRPSLYHFMSDKCAYCESTGHVLSLDSVANRIERMVRRVSHYTRARDVRLQVNPQLAVFLREDRRDRLQALARVTGVGLDVVDDARLHREDFRLISVQNGEDLMRRVAGPGMGNGQNGGSDDNEARRRERRPGFGTGRRPDMARGGREGREPRDGRDVRGPRDVREGGEPRPGRPEREPMRGGRGGGRGGPREGYERGRPPRRGRDESVRPEPPPAPRLLEPAPARAAAAGPPGATDLAPNDPARRRRRRGSRGRGRRGGAAGRPILEDNHDIGARSATGGGTATAAEPPPERP
jgi:ribonuclease G